jgi:hypothetical protein
MSNEKKTKSFNDLSQLSNLFSKDELDEKKFIEEKTEYQEEWVRTTNGHRKMIAKKNTNKLLSQKELIWLDFHKIYTLLMKNR